MITLSHSFDVDADIDKTWAFLQDLTKVATCMPGAALEAGEGGQYVGGLSARIGPISAKYKGTATFLELDEVAHRAVIEAKGREVKGSGSASATITPVLSATATGTKVDVTTEVNVSGRAAQFGRSLLAEVSNSMFEQFAGRLQSVIANDDANSASVADTHAAASGQALAVAEADLGDHGGSLDVVTHVVVPLVKRYAPAVMAVAATVTATALLLRRRSDHHYTSGPVARPIYVVLGPEAFTRLASGAQPRMK